jgi:hypothetical protein
MLTALMAHTVTPQAGGDDIANAVHAIVPSSQYMFRRALQIPGKPGWQLIDPGEVFGVGVPHRAGTVKAATVLPFVSVLTQLA